MFHVQLGLVSDVSQPVSIVSRIHLPGWLEGGREHLSVCHQS